MKCFIDAADLEIPRPKNKRRKAELLFREAKETYSEDTNNGQEEGNDTA